MMTQETMPGQISENPPAAGAAADPDDFDVAVAPLLAPTLLEASAGTGKTFSIKHLALRFIVEAQIPIHELLIVTFTKAATSELRVRVAEHLSAAAGRLSGRLREGEADPLIDRQIELWRAAGITDETALARIEASLARSDDAGIFTIHGFCQRTLDETAFSAGGGLGYELTNDASELARDVVRDFLRRTLDAMPEQADRRALVAGKDWEGKLEALVESPESLILRGVEPEPGMLTPAVEEALGAFIREAPGAYAAMKAKARVRTYGDLLTALHARVCPPADAPAGTLAQARRVVEALRTRWRGVLVDEFQDTDPVQYAILERLFVDAYSDDSRDEGNVLAGRDAEGEAGRSPRALWFVGDPKQAIYRFRSADINTYIRARDRIGRIGRISRLGVNYRSSPGLVRAFNVFWTQSRSSFLREDLVYSRVNEFPKNTGLWLREDGAWREASPMELWATVHSDAWSSVDEIRSGQLSAIGLRIVELIEAGRRGEAAIADKLGGREVPGVDPALPRMRALEARDIAVLVRSNSDVESVRNALARRGVRVRAESRVNVCTTEEAAELGLILRAYSTPGDMRALRAARATRLIGDLLADMDDPERDEARRIEVREMLEDGARRWFRDGPAPAIERLMAACRTRERLLPAEGGERRLANYAHIMELLHAAAKTVTSPAGLAAWLSEAAKRSDEAFLIRPESDANLVTVQTIHKSKGLQYPVVFLAFAEAGGGSGGKSAVHRITGEDGRMELLLSHGETSPSEPERREELEESVRLAYVAMTRAAKHLVVVMGQKEKSKGKKDQWYRTTALNSFTRALVGEADFPDADAREALTALGSADPSAIAVRELRPLCEAAAENPARLSLPSEAPQITTQPARDVWGAWRTSSFTGISRLAEDETAGAALWYGVSAGSEKAGGEAGPGDILDFPKGAQAGTCLHEILELADFAGMAWDDEAAATRRLDFCRREVGRHLSLTGDALERAAEGASQMVRDVLASEIVEGLRLRDVPAARRSAELEFLIPIEGGLTAARLAERLRELDPKYDFGDLRPERLKGFLTGFIDLAFEWRGRFYVLDWKSNRISERPEGYEPRAMGLEMTRHLYRLQYLIYLVALRRFLRARLGESFRDDMIGGAVYVFLRGVRADATTPANPQGVVHDPVSPRVIAELDRLFSGEAK